MASTVSVRDLGQFYFSLPNELQMEIILQLHILDIFSCRRVCQSFNTLLISNESWLVRLCIAYKLPPYCSMLYPPPTDRKYILQDLYMMYRRNKISTKLNWVMISFWRMRFLPRLPASLMIPRNDDQKQFCWRMGPLIFTLCHFYEHRRTCMMEEVLNNNCVDYSPGRHRDTFEQTAKSYGPKLLQEVAQMEFVIMYFADRNLRTRVEGTNCRGKAPTKYQLRAILNSGGIDQIALVLSKTTYAERCTAIDTFMKGLDPARCVKAEENWQYMLGGPFGFTAMPKIDKSLLSRLLRNERAWELPVVSVARSTRAVQAFVCDVLDVDPRPSGRPTPCDQCVVGTCQYTN